MEKIYTQEQGQKGRKKNKVNFSVVLSFTVAIFALFSVAMFGVFSNQGSNVSYAAPTGNSFKMIIPDTTNNVTAMVGIAENGDWFRVPLYYANDIDGANRVYCVEMRKAGGDQQTYTKADLANDPGLIYILNNSFANGVRFTGFGGEDSDYIEVWATQAAIWLYLAEKYPDVEVNKFYAEGEKVETEDGPSINTKNALLTTKELMYHGSSKSSNKITVTGLPTKVRALVDKAKSVTSSSDTLKLTVSPANDQMTKTSDGKFYQTALISVNGTPANAFKNYNIKSVTGIDGVKVVDENGKDLPLTNIAAGKKFYLRIPVNKVSENTTTLKVSVDGNFTIKTGVYYTSGDYQKVVSLADAPQTVMGGTEFEIAGSPDTGMNAAQTIYFIGLIVLLCGIGIVYANAKPVESKQ